MEKVIFIRNCLFFFELSIFSFLIGNNDMHLKIFSMIESSLGWVLAPAYDLLNVTIVNPDDTEELALTLDSKKKKLKKEHFEKLAKEFGLTDKLMQRVFKRMISNRQKAMEWIDQSFLSTELKIAYNF